MKASPINKVVFKSLPSPQSISPQVMHRIVHLCVTIAWHGEILFCLKTKIGSKKKKKKRDLGQSFYATLSTRALLCRVGQMAEWQPTISPSKNLLDRGVCDTSTWMHLLACILGLLLHYSLKVLGPWYRNHVIGQEVNMVYMLISRHVFIKYVCDLSIWSTFILH